MRNLIIFPTCHFSSGDISKVAGRASQEKRLQSLHLNLGQLAIVLFYFLRPVLPDGERRSIGRKTDGSQVPALCFNLLVPPGPEEANSECAAKLRDLARRAWTTLQLCREYPMRSQTKYYGTNNPSFSATC